MDAISVAEAQARLTGLLDAVLVTHEPVCITGERGSAVLVAEDDWRALQETVHLLSVPGVRESVVEGLSTPLDSCKNELDW